MVYFVHKVEAAQWRSGTNQIGVRPTERITQIQILELPTGHPLEEKYRGLEEERSQILRALRTSRQFGDSVKLHRPNVRGFGHLSENTEIDRRMFNALRRANELLLNEKRQGKKMRGQQHG
ncbi:hypothetical protein HZC09_05380 [Candidatus Micrarchaeota archaeon]|nr:hypothetical protein [Candidatus Micrarchaeota archaeon]